MSPVLPSSPALKYLAGYPPALIQQVQGLIDEGRLAETLARRHGEQHEVRSDKALFDYCQSLKERHLRNAPPLDKVCYDAKLRVIQHALGTHTRAPKVQGSKLKMRREIRIASLFREAPAAFLKMIVVHELAHLRELDHNKAFYQLCQHMEPDYAQLEFDLRLYLIHQELSPKSTGPVPGRPKRACIPSGDRPTYSSDEGLT